MRLEAGGNREGNDRISISERIRRDIESRILSGDWSPGFRIPFEHELMADYRCSRMTVSKAIGGLVAAGLIVRRRRAGSFVSSPAREMSVLEIQDFHAYAKRRGEAYSHAIISDRLARPKGDERQQLGLAAGEAIRRVECLHAIGSKPVAFERRLIVLSAAPEAREAVFNPIPPGTWLLQNVPWSRAEHVIRAVNADCDIASLLCLQEREACLVLERRTWAGSALITAVQIVYPGNGQAFCGTFTPSGRQ